jgi:hypothetical protein
MYTHGPGLGAAPKVSRDEAKRAVQNIYLELLLRDPWSPYDAGAEGYVNCLVEGWCNTDFVRTEVIKSPEYRDKELARAQQVYGAAPAAGSSLVPSPGAPSYGSPSYGSPMAMDGGITSMSIAGIPVVYLAGGLVLLMLLKKR